MSVTNPDQVKSLQHPLSSQVHPIPFQQTPLTLLVREALEVEGMRQARVVVLGTLSPCVEHLGRSVETLG